MVDASRAPIEMVIFDHNVVPTAMTTRLYFNSNNKLLTRRESRPRVDTDETLTRRVCSSRRHSTGRTTSTNAYDRGAIVIPWRAVGFAKQSVEQSGHSLNKIRLWGSESYVLLAYAFIKNHLKLEAFYKFDIKYSSSQSFMFPYMIRTMKQSRYFLPFSIC